MYNFRKLCFQNFTLVCFSNDLLLLIAYFTLKHIVSGKKKKEPNPNASARSRAAGHCGAMDREALHRAQHNSRDGTGLPAIAHKHARKQVTGKNK